MNLQRTIDLNADLGEHDGERFAHDEGILDVVSSASVACGAHAGSMAVMRRTVAAARERMVSIGAHPGYPDREGFGRRDSALPLQDIAQSLRQQIEALAAVCLQGGVHLAYVKPHGAMYNRAVSDCELAETIADCVAGIDKSLVILTLPRSALGDAAERCGLRVAREAFIDRAYMSDGTLVPRTHQGAVIDDINVAAARAVEMAQESRVQSMDGSFIPVDAQSFCVHGDSTNALAMVSEARRQLEIAGFTIAPFAP
ncbi:MAG TPA: 5-oxoprolinase subunit PxpA [Gemmatimonadaceae bacterium]|nr:5-oxoprolinase subunit PxpA [Gemmatimonadaceae bacterium]